MLLPEEEIGLLAQDIWPLIAMRALIAQDTVKSTGFQTMDISIFWQVALQKLICFYRKCNMPCCQ